MSERLYLYMPGQQSCWTRIGVWGDGTCPELARVSHCRNCDVYASSGRRLLDRPAPDGLHRVLDLAVGGGEKHRPICCRSPHLVFRVGQAWLAFPATSLREITEPGVIRSVPHKLA